MTNPHTSNHSPLAADDPRISEWLDGRLAPADAADVERAVQASPELVSLVADLRKIRGALRELPADGTPVGLSDSIMAAIASARPTSSDAPSTGSLPLPLGEAGNSGFAPTARQDRQCREANGRRMPWMAMIGALAAGILVTVVVNFSRDDGRDVAFGPAPRHEADAQTGREGEAAIDSSREDRSLAVASERPDEKIEPSLGELAADAPLGGDEAGLARQLANARGGAGSGGFGAGRDATASKTLDAPIESLATSRDRAEVGDESNERGRPYGMKESEATAPQAAGAPPSPAAPLLADTEEPRFVAPAPATEPPFIPPVPATAAPARDVPGAVAGKRSRVDADGLRHGEQVDRLKEQARQLAGRRAAALPAGVVVITVGRPSERRALDHLVAASGLEVTREPDRLELIGDQPAIDGFLIELEEAGLVPAGAAPRRQMAYQQGGRERRSLVLRIVARKVKQGAAAASEEKP